MNAELPNTSDDGRLAVRTEGLRKSFGKQTALQGVDLRVPEGAVYVLVGPNGAGKSTLIHVLMNLIRADSGTAQVLGLDPNRSGAGVRAQIGFVPEDHRGGYSWMTAGQLLQHQAAYYSTWDEQYFDRLTGHFSLRLDQPFGSLSKGQARRVQLAMALAHRPRLLLLDEPTDGLDPIVRDETLGLLAEHLADSPTTVFMSTHRVYEVEKIADHVGLLREGKLVKQLSTRELHSRLLKYRLKVPEGWPGSSELDSAVVRKNGRGREVEWTVWGDESEITSRFSDAGITVHDVSAITLEQAAISLLTRREQS